MAGDEMPLRRSETDRREFLQSVLGAGAAVAGAGLLQGCAGVTSMTSAAPRSGPHFDMSWRSKLKRYRTAYDSPEIYDGAALDFADAAFFGYRATGVDEGDVSPVLILRHAASVMTLDDNMWSRLTYGDKLKDRVTGEVGTKRNPFLSFTTGDKNPYVEEGTSLEALIRRGAIVLACNYALSGIANQLKTKEAAAFPTFDLALAEVHRHVIPGAYVMPNGVFAVSATQDAGCHYMRVMV